MMSLLLSEVAFCYTKKTLPHGKVIVSYGAGKENRTPIFSLGS